MLIAGKILIEKRGLGLSDGIACGVRRIAEAVENDENHWSFFQSYICHNVRHHSQKPQRRKGAAARRGTNKNMASSRCRRFEQRRLSAMLRAAFMAFDQTTAGRAAFGARAAKRRLRFGGRSDDHRRGNGSSWQRTHWRSRHGLRRRCRRRMIEQIKQAEGDSEPKPRPAASGNALRAPQLRGAFVAQHARQPTALRRERVAAFCAEIAVIVESSHRLWRSQ